MRNSYLHHPGPAHLGGPTELIAVRHGQSTANAAFAEAEPRGALSVPISDRDADLQLTDLGRAQADALGHRLTEQPPDLVCCSPYRRTVDTLAIVLKRLADAGVPEPRVHYDERLRDRETGAWEMKTRAALQRSFPEECARRERIGSFYFRPPGGENFPDVALRVRSLLRDALPEATGRRLLIVAHDAVVLMLRFVLEGLGVPELDRIVDHGGVVGNCTITRWIADGPGLRLAEFNNAAHLENRERLTS